MGPFPRLHFMITSMSPVTTEKKKETARNDIQGITEECFAAQNFFAKIADFDAEEDKYMAISVNYRGVVKAKKANAAVQWMKTNKKVCLVEWMPTGFKVGLNEVPAAQVENDELASFERNVVVIGNNTAISRVFSERISKKYDLMYSQRASLPKPERIWDFWRRITWMCCPSKPRMRRTATKRMIRKCERQCFNANPADPYKGRFLLQFKVLENWGNC